MKKILYDIQLIRPVVILLIVIGHCFAAYSGAWNISGIYHIEYYKYINPILTSFSLYSFLTISGYIDMYKKTINPETKPGLLILKSKVRRLLYPLLFFGVLYVLLLNYNLNDYLTYFKIVNGVGHLWFLPMLFGCFVINIFLSKFSFKIQFILAIVLFILAPLLNKLSLNILKASHFYIYFFAGQYLYAKRPHEKASECVTYGITLFFILLFIPYLYLFFEERTILLKFFFYLLKQVINVTGTFLLFAYSSSFLRKENGLKIAASPLFTFFNKVSFGVYLFHQIIILKLLNYLSAIYSITGVYLLPFVLVIISLPLSIFLTYLFFKSRFGRYLV